MTIDVKVRMGLLAVSLALSALGVLAAAHGVYIGPLDGTGPGPH